MVVSQNKIPAQTIVVGWKKKSFSCLNQTFALVCIFERRKLLRLDVALLLSSKHEKGVGAFVCEWCVLTTILVQTKIHITKPSSSSHSCSLLYIQHRADGWDAYALWLCVCSNKLERYFFCYSKFIFFCCFHLLLNGETMWNYRAAPYHSMAHQVLCLAPWNSMKEKNHNFLVFRYF